MLFSGLSKAMKPGEAATAMVVVCEDGTMRVTILWDKDRDYGNDALKAPMQLTGKPEELDEAFERELASIGEVRHSLSESAQAYKALLGDAKAEVASATSKAINAGNGAVSPKRTGAALKTPQSAVGKPTTSRDDDFMSDEAGGATGGEAAPTAQSGGAPTTAAVDEPSIF